ncbi:hypothetical protein [Streptomyces sp. NBC_01497]|uniref:hypothetical protein n=1 Tax=Streptomyces sp. NBC_01497 TaxID=2903885 RepID=UPI002E37ACCB|nr:hypothetical protein [Streptomyces sp. NBC_01497]
MSAPFFRRIMTAIATTILALGAAFAATSPAQAASGNGPGGGDDYQTITWYASAGGRCEGEVRYLNQYAYGLYINAQVAVGCTFWIERSSDDGYTWPGVFYQRSLSTTSSDYSSPGVLDSSAYLARVCFHFNVSGAARHCSNPI